MPRPLIRTIVGVGSKVTGRDSTREPSGVDVQALSSAVCGAVVSAFSEVLGRNSQNGGRSSSSSITGAVRPTLQLAHTPVSGTIDLYFLLYFLLLNLETHLR